MENSTIEFFTYTRGNDHEDYITDHELSELDLQEIGIKKLSNRTLSYSLFLKTFYHLGNGFYRRTANGIRD